jgi:hypothetical protein
MDVQQKTRAELTQRLERVSDSLRSIGRLPNSLRAKYIDRWNELSEEQTAILARLESSEMKDLNGC